MAGLLLGDETLDAVLDLVVAVSQEVVGSTDGSSVSLLRQGSPEGGFETSNATSATAREVDAVQYAHGLGPCVEATRTGRQQNLVVADQAQRWPDFTEAALEAGQRSVLSSPLTVRERTIGALNLYSRADDAYGPAEEAAAERFAAQASVVLANALAYATVEAANENLERALAHRDLIGQAKGIIMARERVSADQAFDVLRRASQRANRKLWEVAREVVASTERR